LPPKRSGLLHAASPRAAVRIRPLARSFMEIAPFVLLL
jgi:hypothetical protein